MITSIRNDFKLKRTYSNLNNGFSLSYFGGYSISWKILKKSKICMESMPSFSSNGLKLSENHFFCKKMIFVKFGSEMMKTNFQMMIWKNLSMRKCWSCDELQWSRYPLLNRYFFKNRPTLIYMLICLHWRDFHIRHTSTIYFSYLKKM